MTSSDLALLRSRVLQARLAPTPADPQVQSLVLAHRSARDAGHPVSELVVTRTGEITTVGELGGQTRGISRVTTEVFAATVGQTALAGEYLPAGHTALESDGVPGWVYDVTTRKGHQFTFFLYRDPYEGRYFVRLIAPELEKLKLAHATHLFSDGHLCLEPSGVGLPVLPQAYAKSVLWAEGIGQLLDGHAWPWGE